MPPVAPPQLNAALGSNTHCMYVTLLDTNVQRGLSSAAFDSLIAAEAAQGVQQYADVWTMMELIAHLASPEDLSYGFAREAMRRLNRRSLLPLDRPPRVIAPSEVQMARLVFGAPLSGQEANVAEFVELARAIGTADPADDLAAFASPIQQIAAHVGEKESWFASYFSDLRQQVNEAAGAASNQERNKIIRTFTRSDEAFRLDAIAHAKRAFDQAGEAAPEPIPADVISRVMPATASASHAVGVLVERIMCDNADLTKSRIRNLLWDQEIAGSIGQSINSLPLLVVTSDSYFRDAAARASHAAAVCSPDEYFSKLGLSS